MSAETGKPKPLRPLRAAPRALPARRAGPAMFEFPSALEGYWTLVPEAPKEKTATVAGDLRQLRAKRLGLREEQASRVELAMDWTGPGLALVPDDMDMDSIRSAASLEAEHPVQLWTRVFPPVMECELEPRPAAAVAAAAAAAALTSPLSSVPSESSTSRAAEAPSQSDDGRKTPAQRSKRRAPEPATKPAALRVGEEPADSTARVAFAPAPTPRDHSAPMAADGCAPVFSRAAVTRVGERPRIHDGAAAARPRGQQGRNAPHARHTGGSDEPFEQHDATRAQDDDAAVPAPPRSSRGDSDGEGAAVATASRQSCRSRNREHPDVSGESTASSTAPAGSPARRIAVVLADVEVHDRRRSCIVPAHLVSAAVPGAYGEVPLFCDAEPWTVVGRITHVWEPARDDAPAPASVSLLRVLPACEGSAVSQELQRNDAQGLTVACDALKRITPKNPHLRGVRILSVRFAVGSTCAACVAFGHPGPEQSERLAADLSDTLQTALRLIWVNAHGKVFSHCDACVPEPTNQPGAPPAAA